MSRIKSESLEPKWSATYAHLYAPCPYCDQENKIYLGNLDDITAPDVEAAKCWSCSKKFWMPSQKEISETNAGFGFSEEDVATCEELGLNSEDDLIETAYCQDGQKP